MGIYFCCWDMWFTIVVGIWFFYYCCRDLWGFAIVVGMGVFTIIVGICVLLLL